MDFRPLFRVAPGARVSLAEINPNAAAVGFDAEDKAAVKSSLERYREEMESFQYRLYADGSKSLLVVLQAMDAAGKDGVIRHVFSAMNPQGTRVQAFKQPTPAEAARDFLWRAHLHAPARGEVVIFNRSHYEDVLVVRVHELVPEEIWRARYEQINQFERLLSSNGTKILKFYLHIDADEQLARFKKRLDDPNRHWKISESDYTERKFWPDYIQAFEEAIEKTSTEESPWYIIPSNQKWFRNLAISQIITETMREMNLTLPMVKVDLEAVRQHYHAAKSQAEKIKQSSL
ncbi:polyphosphate kinase 2 family protein [Halothiobacillus sp. DCM-1]|uniref:polyphosphate kinase 2 family protein n=1 Tax=Halothiobacillus sp. DCM-1 TaxID=3112558 RepID=UPI003244CC7E